MPTKRSTLVEKLSAYTKKRDFKKSPEPSGKTPAKRKTTKDNAKAAHRLKFCVQKHLASHLHYDFRLEHRGVLLSWAVPKGPSLKPGDKRLAMKVEDHPIDYGDFEGVIPSGYGAGVVMLWDTGFWQAEVPDIDAALENGDLKFSLEDTKLKGSWVLVRTGAYRGSTTANDGRNWLLIKHRDKWAGDVDVTEFAPLSVKSFVDLPDILAADKVKVWKSNRPASPATKTGKLLKETIAKAKQIRKK